MPLLRPATLAISGLLALALGCDARPGFTSTPEDGGLDAGAGAGGDAGPDGGADAGPDAGPVYTSLFGVWQVNGHDDRGAYEGQLELRDRGGGVADLYRVVRYTGAVTVEDGRELWTAWTGSATVTGLTAQATVSLQRAQFVRSRGGITRTAADLVPLAVSGAISATGGAQVHWSTAGSATGTASGLPADDTLTAPAPSAAAPIFVKERTYSPANDQPSASTRAALDQTYATFQALPAVQAYADRPEYKAGVYQLIIDKTDYQFYRTHPNALRVVDKVIDAPSLGETLARANAYRHSLAEKAALFDEETPRLFLEPATGQLVNSVYAGAQEMSGDGALWTSAYVASQAYRYFVTHDASLLPTLARSAASIQLLMEIVPDQTTFARTIRASTGAATGKWHAGTGAFAAYEWLEGGNNDMYKGLFYGTLTAYAALCDPLVAGQDALCARLRTNAQHMLNDLAIVNSGSGGNHLMAAWLVYYLTGKTSALTSALTDWTKQAPDLEQAGFQTRSWGTADWSGTHLTFVEFIGLTLLTARAPLPTANTTTSLRKGIEKMQGDFSPFRMGMWSVLFATKVSSPAAVDAENARWRLREMPAPRMSLDIEHRVGPEFVMAPFPSLPWKNDWTTTDRTDGIYGPPLFELALDVYMWRSGPFDYNGSQVGRLSPSVDYLHAYWLGRYLGLFSQSE